MGGTLKHQMGALLDHVYSPMVFLDIDHAGRHARRTTYERLSRHARPSEPIIFFLDRWAQHG